MLNETSVEFLIACKTAQRAFLLRTLHDLAANPSQQGDYLAKDDTGRTVRIKQAGRYLITFWNDSFVRELRVINIERF